MGGAALAGLLAAMCLVTMCVVVLAAAMPLWAATLIMAFVLGAAAAIMFVTARMKLRDFHALPKQTTETLREDLEWAKHQTR
jgi:cobalamin biosynthesis protein CobD/CbiB